MPGIRLAEYRVATRFPPYLRSRLTSSVRSARHLGRSNRSTGKMELALRKAITLVLLTVALAGFGGPTPMVAQQSVRVGMPQRTGLLNHPPTATTRTTVLVNSRRSRPASLKGGLIGGVVGALAGFVAVSVTCDKCDDPAPGFAGAALGLVIGATFGAVIGPAR